MQGWFSPNLLRLLRTTKLTERPTLRSETIFSNWKLFKIDEKCFLFHLESSFRFDLLFWSSRKNGLIRKVRLISKFMTLQPEKQTIAIHKMSNVSLSKDNQPMKFIQLIEYKMKKMFLEKSFTKFEGETITRPFSKKSKLSISLD